MTQTLEERRRRKAEHARRTRRRKLHTMDLLLNKIDRLKAQNEILREALKGIYAHDSDGVNDAAAGDTDLVEVPVHHGADRVLDTGGVE